MSDYETTFCLSGLGDKKGILFDETDDDFSVLEARTRRLLRDGKSLCWLCKKVVDVSSCVRAYIGTDVSMSCCYDCMLSGYEVRVESNYQGFSASLDEKSGSVSIRRLK